MSLKEHIATTAIQLFARNGIKRVSMDDVARKANVSKRTLYDFYRDKEDLLLDALRSLMMPVSEEIERLSGRSETALDTILLFNEKMMENPKWLCEDFFEDVKRYPQVFRLLSEGKTFFVAKLIDLLKRGKKEAVFMSDIDYDIISLLAQKQFSKSEPSGLSTKYAPEEVHNTLFFIFLRGICTDSGRNVIEKYLIKKKLRQEIQLTN